MESGLLAGALLLTTLLSPAPTPTAQTMPQIVQEVREYRVQEGDSLGSIAEKEYGSSELWVNIWNDNEFIKNPNKIEKNWKIKLSTKKPVLKEDLKPNLKKIIDQETIIEAAPAVIQVKEISTSSLAQSLPNNSPKVLNEAQIAFLGQCESGMTATRNSGNGYYGAFQFSIGTWNSMGTAYARADLAPIEVQIDAVQRLLQRSSIFTQFPGCARKMQANGIL